MSDLESALRGQTGSDRHAAKMTRLPSRPGEFHPEPLTDPDLILSHHPARASIEGCRLPLNFGLLPLPVGPIHRRWPAPFAPQPLQPLPALLRSSPPLSGASVLRPCGWTACVFSLGIAG